LDAFEHGGTTVRWHGHSTISLSFPRTRVYVDPYRLHGRWPDASHILITHPHHDHLDPDAIRKLDDGDTEVICPVSVSVDDVPVPSHRLTRLEPGEETSFANRSLKIEAKPAYNPGKNFHPKSSDWLGYVVETEGTRVYHAGDTGPIPPSLGEPVDLGLVPVDGIYTMSAVRAARWTDKLEIGNAAPIHYGTERGTVTDALRFRRKLSDTTPIHLEAVRLTS
jgi:L-ascorbate metabolism protein UlaG (beta-lactamase superfamily)